MYGQKLAFRHRRRSALAFNGKTLTPPEQIVSVVVSTKRIMEFGGAGYGGGSRGGGAHGNAMAKIYGNDKYTSSDYVGLFTNYTDNVVVPGQTQAAIAAATNAGFDRVTMVIAGLFYNYESFLKAYNELPNSVKRILVEDYDFDEGTIERSFFNEPVFVRKSQARAKFSKYATLAYKAEKAEDDFRMNSPFGSNRIKQVSTLRTEFISTLLIAVSFGCISPP
jgi:hypothetical protein